MFSLQEYFDRYPKQLNVAEMFFEYGIAVRNGSAYVGNIKQSESALARAANVDRRIITSTIERIEATPELLEIFSKLESAAVIANAAQNLGCTAIEIIPEDDRRPGLMSQILNVISEKNINIVQATVTRSKDGKPSHLIITVNGIMEGKILSSIRMLDGVSKVVIL